MQGPDAGIEPRNGVDRGFTLIEVLVVISIIAALLGILMPALHRARRQSKSIVCATNLHTVGQGWNVYANDNRGQAVPARLPLLSAGGLDNAANQYRITTGLKFRPRWPALLQGAVGLPALLKPLTTRARQDYDGKVYVCPAVSEWTDERNAAYGYNYQFLGSHRVDEGRLRNLPVPLSRIRASGDTVVITDSLGTAAAFPHRERRDYANKDRDVRQEGNCGWILDPPRLEPGSSRAGGDGSPRTGPALRHMGKTNVLFADGHARGSILKDLGYRVEENGVVAERGIGAHNRLFSGTGHDDSPP